MEKISFDYKSIFNHLPYAFIIGEMQYDAAGEPIDFYILASNRAFNKMVDDKNSHSLLSDLLHIDAKFLLNLHKVNKSGKASNFSFYFVELEKKFKLKAFLCDDFLGITWEEVLLDSELEYKLEGNKLAANYQLLNQELSTTNQEITLINQKLALQEQLYRELAEMSNDLFLLWEEPAKITYINKRFVDIFEREVKELEGRFDNLFKWIQPQQRLNIINAFEEAWKNNQKIITLEFPIFTPKGNIKRVRYREILIDHKDNIRRRASIVTEITDKYKSKSKLAEYQLLLDNIVEKLPMGMQVFDDQGNCTKVNRRFQELNLYPRQLNLNEYEGSNQSNLIARFEFFNDLLQQKTTLKRELFVNDNQSAKYNLYKAYKETIFPLLDSTGNIKYIVALIEDITDRKYAESAFHESEEKFRQLIENIDTIFWIREASHTNFVYISPAYQNILDSDPIDLYKNPKVLLQKVHPQDLQKLENFIDNSFDKEFKDFECRMIVNGKIIWLNINSYLLNSKAGGLRQIAIAEDITSLKKFTDMVLQKNSELIKTNQELDHFVYRVSHNLRSPITSIMGLLDLMTMHGMEQELEKYCSLIKKSISGLDYIIQEIVDYSKNARTKIDVEPVDFHALINEVLENIGYLYENKNIEINKILNIEKRVISDYQRLKILLNNILSNAFKYTDPKKTLNKITIKAVLDKDLLIVEINDNGIGIQNEHKDRIFDMFYRGTNRSNGAGLGLAIVKEIVNRLHAQCELQSEVGAGSTFCLKIPVKIK